MGKIRLVETDDGSSTLYNEDLKEVYHSKHGALTESRHVFLNAGLVHLPESVSPINLLEVGMGTGLNVLLSALAANDRKKNIRCIGIEPFPPETNIIAQLNYTSLLPDEASFFWQRIQQPFWNRWIRVNPYFALLKCNKKIEQISLQKNCISLIYFDAFAPEIQPELWSQNIFDILFHWMMPGGILVTYSVKGEVQRNLKRSGFKTEKIPGPPGKREMLRASKTG